MQIETDDINQKLKIILKYQNQKPNELIINKNTEFATFQQLIFEHLRIPILKQKIIYQGKQLTSDKYHINNLNELKYKSNTPALFQVMGQQELNQINNATNKIKMDVEQEEEEEQKIDLNKVEQTKQVFLEDLISSGLKTYYFDKQIKDLSVMRIEITDKFEDLFENFQYFKQLYKVQLDFSKQDISNEQLAFFFDKITNIKDIEYLTIDFGKCALGQEGLQTFETKIDKLEQLDTLNINLEQTNIQDPTLISLSIGISKLSETLSCLDLCLNYNQITMNGIQTLMDNITKLPLLISLQLSLWYNNFSLRTASKTISDRLFTFTLLTNVDIDLGHQQTQLLQAHENNARQKLSLIHSILGSQKVLKKHKFLRVLSIIRQFLLD